MPHNREWWEKAVVYQIYPRSFRDASGDGLGDIAGILERIDYLDWLGVDAIWMSPVFPSPMKDFGYDVSDYCAVDPRFGTLEELDRLIEEVHRRDMSILLDFVPNHTSSEHPWFLEARSSRDSPKRDWYLWADPSEDGEPPTNWLSVFGGPAWEWDEATGQYYYHAFLAEQPDLNWRNPEVREAMFDNMRFWLDRDVDGFRVDVIWHLIKDDRLRDNPHNPNYDPEIHTPYESHLPVFTTDHPEVHDVVRQMRRVIDEYDDRIIIGEVYLPVDRLVTYYGETGAEEAHLPFNFSLIHCPWDARRIEAVVDEYEASLPDTAWPNWVLSNHDQPRIASRIGLEQARVAGMLLLSLRGTPTMYYGDEIGLEDVPIPAHRVRDPQQLNQENVWGRDPARTPMQWDSSHNAGFTDADEPWLPLAENWEQCNVETLSADEQSILSFYQKMIALRRRTPALLVGEYVPHVDAPEGVFVFERRHDESFLVALNFGAEHHSLRVGTGVIALDTGLTRRGEECSDAVELGPNEGLIIHMRGRISRHAGEEAE